MFSKGAPIKITQRKNKAKFLDLIFYATLLFAIHRALSFESLMPTYTDRQALSSIEKSKIFLVGILSDFWVSLLICAFSISISRVMTWVANLKERPKTLNFEPFVILALGILTALHQSYVEFFRFQVVPFHISYLFDFSFLQANGQSLTSTNSLIILAFTFLFAWMSHIFKFSSPRNIYFIVIILGLVAHNRNIHWRVQWFIPEHLQVHFLEKLYFLISQNNTPQKLSNTEWKTLFQSLQYEGDIQPTEPFEILKVLAPPPPMFDELAPPAHFFRENFAQEIHTAQKPLLLVVLLESLRPSEMGIYAQNSQTLTPILDQLASRGFVFLNAFATGSVTRGGQEAVLCGLPSQRNFSLMRGGILFDYPSCLFTLFQKEAETFWYHGGDARFDNQLQFWKSKGVHDTMASDSFSPNDSRTSWGIGDITFLRTAAKKIHERRNATTKPFLLGSLLTISNHIPWDIPDDLPPQLHSKPPFNLGHHPSHKSTSYTDHAIWHLVENLKKYNIWEHSIVVFISDHGTSLPPYNNIYSDHKNITNMLYSHIAFIVSGGLAEKIVLHNPKLETKISQITGQASVAAFFADLIKYSTKKETSELEWPMLAEHPFAVRKKRPVLSSIEDTLFSPASGRAWPLSKVEETEDPELLYYRSIIQLFNTPIPK